LLTKVIAPKPIKTISKRLLLLERKFVLNVEITLYDKGQPEEQVIALFYETGYYRFPVELNVKYY
jgi:hypothetical protein